MNTCFRSIVLSTLLSVCGVHHVSGFTQTDTDAARDDLRSSQSAVRVYVAAESAAFDTAGRARNLTVTTLYRPIIDAMLSRSPTFRRQCARIAAAPDLVVLIRSDPPTGTRASAVTHIHRLPGGGLEAVVQIGPSNRLPELIAHELEHIIEQLDGVDLRVKSRLRESGVRQSGELEAFETTRAIVTGLRVAREVVERAP